MTRKECFAALGIQEGADMAEIKRAYRKLAFALHPDLNPDVPDAARRFQRLNEAYVLLSHSAAQQRDAARRQRDRAGGHNSAEAGAKAREEAYKAYQKAESKAGAYARDASATRENGTGAEPGQGRDKEELLRDILQDPFARRVFEDIYSHINEEGQQRSATDAGRAGNAGTGPGPDAAQGMTGAAARRGGKKQAARPRQQVPGVMSSMVSKVRGWLRRQIDDEQIVRLPGASLVPGARVRLEIQHGFSGEAQVVELTLPPEFVPGKPMRLKGMGKRMGNLR
ncbi:DnaJ domain-containing protein, partial [Desulfovibrio sp. OttesenSCG-928-A18]|nr:DnaJ domain-containing protein [Desulfovibrio sp. OttesenSCG-928-A18]